MSTAVSTVGYTTGQIDAGPWHFRVVRQADLPALKKRRNDLQFQDVLSNVANGTGGYGADALDAFQLVQRHLKESGIDAALNVQEYGAYMATTFQGKYEGMGVGPFSISWEPHSNLYGMYVPEQARNSSHVTDAKMLALLREEMRSKDLAARKKLVLDLQRHAAEQQYYVYLYSLGYTTLWPNYVKG